MVYVYRETFFTIILKLCILGAVVWALSNGYGKDIIGFLQKASTTTSWCMGLESQIAAREASPNPMAHNQIPALRQQQIEHGC
jgi:hypothetical protein